MLKRLRHPNIVLFMGVSESDTDYYIVQEFVKGGGVNNLIRNQVSRVSLLLTNLYTLRISRFVAHSCEFSPFNGRGALACGWHWRLHRRFCICTQRAYCIAT